MYCHRVQPSYITNAAFSSHCAKSYCNYCERLFSRVKQFSNRVRKSQLVPGGSCERKLECFRDTHKEPERTHATRQTQKQLQTGAHVQQESPPGLPAGGYLSKHCSAMAPGGPARLPSTKAYSKRLQGAVTAMAAHVNNIECTLHPASCSCLLHLVAFPA